MAERRVIQEHLSDRFARWLIARGWTSDARAATALDSSVSMIRKIRVGVRAPGRKLANTIERESASWPEGPIRASEWDAARVADDLAPTGTGG